MSWETILRFDIQIFGGVSLAYRYNILKKKTPIFLIIMCTGVLYVQVGRHHVTSKVTPTEKKDSVKLFAE